ncbi:LysM peptidoglycan-binding domain-containing protein [Paracrocinitomix mangrovi]|uniref:amino acid ABC transporter substrate-binding protein n=1 Tax=Paracrocinitomix mangrovi TaxID=2862509 RepID=UPI001C8CF5FC|nr:LysM peptidoglycan-binding domain-containing protein [Paracrocinitomix mangrovi]UKN01501.1 LysM peptidoglycan-binding domain-containing protein [Paracrocinitomix mangrovi]
MKNLLLILSIFMLSNVFAQPEDAVVKTIEGKKYYIHVVAQGNTLYGIHSLYNTEIEDILNANPGLSDNLTIGQQILIPIDVSNQNFYNEHTVAEGETLYGISRKYNCTVDDLKNINPGIESGLQIGQKLKIPKPDSENVTEQIQEQETEVLDYNISLSDSIVNHTVLEHETLYSISKRYMVSSDTIRLLNNIRGNKVKKGDVLLIPIKKVNYTILEKQVEDITQEDSLGIPFKGVKKGTYKIAVFLPFMFAQNDIEMSKTLKIGQHRELDPTTKISFQFYQGLKLAVDSLKQAGLNVDLYAFDTKKDSNAIAKIMDSEEFNNVDLVIGPLYKNTIAYVVNRCAKENIKVVLPFKVDAGVLHEHSNVFKCVTSNMTLMDGTIDYLVENHAHHNIIILKPYSESDKALYERAKARFNEKITGKPSMNGKILEYEWGSSSGREINAKMRKDTTSIFIIPSNDPKYVTGALNRLNKVVNLNPYAKNLKVVAFGFEDWNNFDAIDVLHREKLNQHYSTYRYVDYNTGKGLNFVKSYRYHTGIDPTVYSTQGFDVGMYFLSAMYLYGTSFDQYLKMHNMPLVQNSFSFKSIAAGSGFENQSVSVVKYQNFELVPCKGK